MSKQEPKYVTLTLETRDFRFLFSGAERDLRFSSGKGTWESKRRLAKIVSIFHETLDKLSQSCQYEVKPMPYRFCEGCLFNGCYPWNTNPLVLCMKLGGLHPPFLVTEGDTVIPRECASFTPVIEVTWSNHLKDKKKEAKLNEETRVRAMDGKVLSNHPLPAESISLYRIKRE